MNYKKINRLLLGLIILVNTYVILAPVWPQVVFWLQSRGDTQARLQEQVSRPARASGEPANRPDSLTIPAMLFEGAIHEGTDTYAELNKGVWLWPSGSRPDQGGNTIMLAHRFTYTNPRGAFYFLDRVETGDEIGVTYHNKEYVYKVTGTKVVKPTETGILDATAHPTLTLYTCTPLWNPTQRLVVSADLERSE